MEAYITRDTRIEGKFIPEKSVVDVSKENMAALRHWGAGVPLDKDNVEHKAAKANKK
jgi:hypothetical protein